MLKLRTPKLAIAVVAFCAISVAGFSTNWTNVFAAIEGFGSKVEADAVQPVDVRPANMLAPLVGTYNIPGDYPTLDAAITDLNAKGLGGAVTLNLLADNPQTAPAGGYVIGGSGSVLLTTTSMSNIVSIVGNGNTITASSALTAGNLNDAIFKLVGADWVTISGFTMTENTTNTTTTAGSNNMTEWGVALLYVSPTDGAQNDTIMGNTIDLDRTYQNTFGIYANATHSATAVTTSATATGAAGGNSGLKIYANNITDVNNGIVVVGPTAAADQNDGIEIGGSAANANTISNFGTTGTFSGYANVSGTVNGILVRNSRNVTISKNSITSSNGGVTSGTLNGIQIPAASNTPTGTFSVSINNNSISLKSSVAAGAINGINSPSGSASTASTISINNNDFNNFGHTIAGATGTITFITNSSTYGSQNILNNTFTNNVVNTTGSVTFISNSNTLPAAGVKNVNGNSIATGFTKSGAGGTVTFFTDSGGDLSGTTNNANNNNFSFINVTGATTVTGISDTNGGSPNKTVSNNVVSNIAGGTGPITAYNINNDGGTTIVNGNTASNITNGGAINGVTFGTTGGGTTTASLNNINTFSATSGTSLVAGINLSSGSGTRTLSKNKIYNLENTSASGSVWGLFISSVANTVKVQNNLIGDLRTSNAAGESLRGINVNSATANTSIDLSFNTVYLNSPATGSNFASTGIFHTTSSTATTATLNLRDNIIVNTSTSTGTGNTVAYRRSSSTLANYGSVSNNNLFFAGTPGASDLIYSDGTNNASTLSAYQALVSARDSASISEDPTFTTTNGANAGFLHIDPAAATQIQGGGVPITGITDDYDGDSRNATMTDIGADEFTGSTVDFVPPVISYTAFLSTSLATNRTLNATIMDPSMIAGGANSPRIYFKKNNGSYFSTQCSGTYACTIDYSLIGGVAVGDVISYFVIAQDVPGNVGANPGGGLVAANVNSVTRPPTTPNTYSIITAVPSSVDVGAGQTFTSLSNNDAGGIFNAINNGVLDRNVTINITSDLATETGAVALNQWNEDGAGGYSVTIKPADAARIITGNSTNSVIRLNGADNVTIDGSLTGGTATGVGGNSSLRNLTIQNTNTSATAGAVVAVMQGANSANNITIKNVIVSGQDPTQTLAGIHVGGNTVGASPSMRSNNNVVIDNCAFKRTTIGIFDNGASIEAAGTGNIISHNDLTATGPDRLRRVGLLFFNQNGIRVSENAIGGITDDEGIDAIGIAAGIQNVTTTTTTSGGVFNAIISKNKISGVTSTNAAGLSAAGIAIAGDPTAGNFISNNMISGVSAPSISPDIVAGIFVSGVAATNTHLFYNSVSMSGDRGGATGQGASYGLAISGANPTVELKNNVLYNTQTSSGGADARSYAIGIGTSAFTNLSSNFNDFFTSGANSGRFRIGSLDTGGTDLAGLDVWQSATSGDANSLSDDPLFINPVNDPHISGISPVVNAGTVLGAINDDIDGQSRGGQPDMGADEVFTGSIQFSAVSYTVPEAGPTAILTVKRIGGTDGAVSVDYATSGGTATGGAMCGGSVDYVNTSGTITFAGGDGADKTINVPICDDSAYEGNETFNTTLSNATGGATIGMTASASTIVADDETVPSVQFSSDAYSTVEAFRSLSSEGVPGATINITLSGASQSNVTVHYATNNGTATGGAACTAGVDYLSVSGTATILSGQTSTSFFVPTCADTVVEEDETVTLLLSGPSVATLGTPSLAILTILDTDVAMPGSLQLSSPTYSIGEAGGMATITVGRTGGSSGAVGVSFATSNGTASGGGVCSGSVDYINTSGTLMWADGDTANKTFTTQVCNDLVPEPNETVNITLSNATGGASIGTPANSVLTIVNDDVPGSFSVNNVRVWEGNSGTTNATFTISYLGNASPASVNYSTSNGTAIAGSDYVPTNGTVMFSTPPTRAEQLSATIQSQTVTVSVIGDTNKEENETFFLNLTNPINAVISDNQGVGIINDDDRTFVSDFDHDLTSDLSVFRPSEGTWYVLQTTSATPKIVPFGNSTDRPVPGDYDGDGRVDYAVWRESTGDWLIKLSSDNSEMSVNWGLPGDKPVQGDYDGDGKTDIAIYRPSTGTWWFILSSDGSRPAFQFGLSGDLPVQADFDGDAKTDIAVYRDGTWYIARSSDNQVQVTKFGISTDKPVVGDFDGDGSDDLAIYRDGDWWILNTLTGTVTSLHWGLASDIPVPADYDSDGITDISVFRPSNGDWYILESTTNSLIGVHWGASGDIPIPAGYLHQ